jgi:hypothetical protein
LFRACYGGQDMMRRILELPGSARWDVAERVLPGSA